MRLDNYCPNISMETTFMNTENSKTNEPHKFVHSFSHRLYLRSSNKHVGLRNLCIYYTWKNIRQQDKNNKLKIIVPTWNDEFELPDDSYSVSDIQDFIEYIIKKHETLPTNPGTHIYIKRIKNRVVLRLRRWIPNPGVPCSKPLGRSKVNSAFHPPEVDKMSTRNSWELSGKK